MSYNETSAKSDNIKRGQPTKPNNLGTGLFIGLRFADVPLQYLILSRNLGSSLIEKTGARTLPHGPALITNSFLDRLNLSPYRLILLSMAAGSAIKQNYWIASISNEEMPTGSAVGVSVFNTIFNGLNSLFFITNWTSASANGEHFPQTPLLVGSALYAAGILTETLSEVQRKMFKQKPQNKGKVYQGGLFGQARHINYAGYIMWRTGYAIAAGGWTWGVVVAAFFSYDFAFRGIPVLSHYCEERVSFGLDICCEGSLLTVHSTASSTRSTSATRLTSCCHISTRMFVFSSYESDRNIQHRMVRYPTLSHSQEQKREYRLCSTLFFLTNTQQKKTSRVTKTRFGEENPGVQWAFACIIDFVPLRESNSPVRSSRPGRSPLPAT